ncbi:hypothetical protein SDC9_100866 [bioreactor metagenome]|uniref:Uncharacterized protein n=1 Tax=bioreactor metagenome TaxID=1076179 RepID=A0A645AT98_9ZZZZ
MLARPPVERFVVDHAALTRKVVCVEVCGNVQMHEVGEFLIHHSNARAQRFFRRAEVHFLVKERNGSFVRLLHAREELDERGFSRAVFAYQAMYFAFLDFKPDVFERHDARETLGDAGKAHRDIRHFLPPIIPVVPAPTWRRPFSFCSAGRPRPPE